MQTTDLGVATDEVRRRWRGSPRRLARWFRALAIGLPALVLVMTARSSVAELAAGLGVPAPVEPGWLLRGVLVVLALAPVLATSVALEALRRCALAVHAGRGMTLDVARGLRQAGSWMLVASAAALVVPTLAGMLLSAPTGQLVVQLHFGTGVVLPIVCAWALRLVSGVIVEAAALADDHAGIV